MKDTSPRLQANIFSRGEALVSRDLAPLTPANAGKGLNLTGIEVIGFLAAKVLVPVVCAFVKDILYERYKNLKTRSAADEAKQQLLASVGPYKLQIERATVIREISKSLRDEGVPAAIAEKAVEDALNYVQKELTSTTPKRG